MGCFPNDIRLNALLAGLGHEHRYRITQKNFEWFINDEVFEDGLNVADIEIVGNRN